MTKTFDAVYENGMLRLPSPLPLPEKSRVTVTIETGGEDLERAAWLEVSQSKLAEAWDDADDVFNELRTK